jgi:hypothetical protein
LLIYLLDATEEFRDLSLEKWNSRKLTQEHMEKMLDQQKEYWKQRGRIKWTTVGDKNTKFFYANATIRHNKNSIMVLKSSEEQDKFTHDEKATILWEAYKERLGTSEFTQVHFDLNDLLEPDDDLTDLVSPFDKEQIDNIIKNHPSGKSPCPDGLNSDFMKKCWSVISTDFYELCFGFFEHNIYL